MRRLYLSTTAAFWLLVTIFWAGSYWSSPPMEIAAAVADKSFGKADLEKHATPADCWMAIRGSVYDVSAYVPEHPSKPEVIEPWCGKEATEAYNTKTKARSHSAYADELLASYRIGKFAAEEPR